MATINKRETSYEGLAENLKHGEDGISAMATNTKNQLLCPKYSITKADLANIEPLRQVRESIDIYNEMLKHITDTREAHIIKKAIIELRKDQYIIKNAYCKPILIQSTIHSTPSIPLDEKPYAPDTPYTPRCITLRSPAICAAILRNYHQLKSGSYGRFTDDIWYLMQDFDHYSSIALKDEPIYSYIVEKRIDGISNTDLQKNIEALFGKKHTTEYLSSLWNKKIPALIADKVEEDYLNWYYLQKEKGRYKRCGRCGKVKLAHPRYFSRNGGNSFYSICKECRKGGRK